MIKFVIFTLPRTGSTLLSKSLNNHPEIFCDDEIFHFSFRDYFSVNQFRFFKIPLLPKKLNYLINYPATLLRLKNFLDKYFTNKPNESFKARGFKLMYYQTFYMPGLITYLRKNHVKIILLLRENTFRNALSDMRARATGIYHHENKEALSDLPKLYVDVNALKNKMDHINHQNKKLENLINDMDCIKIRYEDFADWENAINKITNFLNVSTQKIAAGANKLNSDNLEDMISNADEVKAWLKENDYADYLN